MSEYTLANIPENDTADICPNCSRAMREGEPVNMTWNGAATSHIDCVAAQNEQQVRRYQAFVNART